MWDALQLLVYEHVSGGGFVNGQMSPSILSEGYGMLRSVASDLKAAGHNVTTLLDSRLSTLNPPIDAEKIVSVSFSDELYKNLQKLSETADAVYLIAPESGHTLQKLVELVETSGGRSFNSKVTAIRKTSNKMTIYEILKKKGLAIPETVEIDPRESPRQIKQIADELGYPLVLKPQVGVGCCGISVVEDESQMVDAVEKAIRESPREFLVAQKLVEGISVSASVISTGERALPVTLNKQMVTLASPYEKSSYNGGIVPFDHVQRVEALKAARKAVESVDGLSGYVGVDMILTSDGPVVIDVNPRLTTSYIGLRKTVKFNPAQAIVDSILKRQLPKNVQNIGYAYFKKVMVPLTCQVPSETYKLSEVISPPFLTVSDEPPCALLLTHSERLEDAQKAFYRAKRNLLKLCQVSD